MSGYRNPALEAYARGERISEIAARYDVSPTTISNWARLAGLPPRSTALAPERRAAFEEDLPTWTGSLKGLSRKHGTSFHTAMKWREAWEARGGIYMYPDSIPTDEDAFDGDWVRVGLILKPAAA